MNKRFLVLGNVPAIPPNWHGFIERCRFLFGDFRLILSDPVASILTRDFDLPGDTLFIDALGRLYDTHGLIEYRKLAQSEFYLVTHDATSVFSNSHGLEILNRFPNSQRHLLSHGLVVTNFSSNPIIGISSFIHRLLEIIGRLYYISILVQQGCFSHIRKQRKKVYRGYWQKNPSSIHIAILSSPDNPIEPLALKELPFYFPQGCFEVVWNTDPSSLTPTPPVVLVLGGDLIDDPPGKRIRAALNSGAHHILYWSNTGDRRRLNPAYLGYLSCRRFLTLMPDLFFLVLGFFFLIWQFCLLPCQSLLDRWHCRGRFSPKTGGLVFVARGHDWNGLRRRPQHLMSLAQNDYQCLFVERKIFLSDILSLKKKVLNDSLARRRWTNFILGGKFATHRLLYIPYLDVSSTKSTRITYRVSRWISTIFLQLAMHRAIGKERSTCLLGDPQFPIKVLEAMGFDKIFYNCLDDYATYPMYSDPFRNQLIKHADMYWCKKSNGVITVNDLLTKNRLIYNRNTHSVKNGVDYAHYSLTNRNNTSFDTILRAIKSPVIGYSGGLSSNKNDKINHELLFRIVKEHQDWHYLIIGPFYGMEQTPLFKLPNITFLGFVPYSDLPSVAHYVDVWILPHQINELTDNMSPLKLFDYLATGKPIVTTPVKQVLDYADVVEFAETAEDFSKAIYSALNNSSDSTRRIRRMEVARQNSWQDRYRQLKAIISSV